MANRDHERAVQAHRCVAEVNDDPHDDVKKKYRSLVRSAGTLIHQAGLFQTMGFYFQKGKTHHRYLAGHLLRWLFPNQPETEPPDNLYYQRLLGCADDEARWHTAEAQAFILWLKRFAEAILPEPEAEDAED
ncbi:MAG: type III-B CRISPR module-associated protein Cmr5 [Desulfobacca sp.]|uniref:type III-B CRISPR module-associated protein Cmr5 n=1 Tax=Desulfobacca sp. TaxID=2067990 RepID=UPI00404940C3